MTLRPNALQARLDKVGCGHMMHSNQPAVILGFQLQPDSKDIELVLTQGDAYQLSVSTLSALNKLQETQICNAPTAKNDQPTTPKPNCATDATTCPLCGDSTHGPHHGRPSA